MLDPPDAGPDPTAGASRLATGARGMLQCATGAARVVPLLHWLPYAANPGTYTQWWLAETVGEDATDTKKECKVYLAAFTGITVDYLGIP